MKKIIILIILVVFLNCFFIERYFVRFPEVEFFSEKIPKEFDGFRIAVISDLHLGFLSPNFWIKNILEKVNKLNADLIVGTGDYVINRNKNEELLTVWPLLNELKGKNGVYLVNGNHDHWANHELALDLLEKSGKSLRHKHVKIKKQNSEIVISGTGDLWEDEVGIDKSLKGTNPKDFRIVLSHNPDVVDTEYKEKVDLFITGHTHGGQIRIPIFNYAPVLPIKNKKYDKGLKKNKKDEFVFISAGIGWSILPLRFFCPAEIPIIVLRNKMNGK